MARKPSTQAPPSRKPAAAPRPGRPPRADAAAPTEQPVPPDPRLDAPRSDGREAAVDALMRLAAERDWSDIDLPDIAEAAGLSLAQLRAAFPSKGAVLAAFSRRIDQAVLDGADRDMADEPARERLFDTLMRRIDMLQPHKAAIEGIARSMARDPLSAAAWNRVAVNSMQWMLASSGIATTGPLGALRAQGLAIAWSRIVRAWLDDEDEGLARTMSRIDRELRSGERWMEHAGDLLRIAGPFRRIAERAMHRRSRLRERFADRSRRGAGDDAEAV